MKVLPTKVHGVVDYAVSALLIALPWLLGFAHVEAAKWVLIANGVAGVLYSLVTDYELGVARLLSMRAHLALDMGVGALVAASPWLFGFADQVLWPHVIVGVFEILAGLSTRTVPKRPEAVAAPGRR